MPYTTPKTPELTIPCGNPFCGREILLRELRDGWEDAKEVLCDICAEQKYEALRDEALGL